ncbi:agglutinin-like [Humulus lupulus]|uniref:agglutinin-like n=1 Tax=Humulus lupulus TaxID=3486 RepID=UPI002B403A70|nr:agglutinin-like [Humulus lupulus]
MFIQSLRSDLASGTESYDIPVLRMKAAAVGDNQFVYVKLFNPRISITFTVYALNSYVVAYQVDAAMRCYFFKEAHAKSQSLLFNQFVIQMVAEAARLKNIQQIMEWNGFQSGFLPGGYIISYENKWEDLSKAIQQSKDGKFSAPIQLLNEDYTPHNVSTVSEVQKDMGLLLNVATMMSQESFDQRAATI